MLLNRATVALVLASITVGIHAQASQEATTLGASVPHVTAPTAGSVSAFTPCQSQPKPVRKATAVRPAPTSGPVAQGNEVTIYCTPSPTAGGQSPTQTSQGNTGGQPPPRPSAPQASAVNPPPKPPSEAHEVQLGFKDMRLDIKSPSPWVFGITFAASVAVVAGLLFFLRTPSTGEPGRLTATGSRVVSIVALLMLTTIVYIYFTREQPVAACRSQIEGALASTEFQQQVVRQVEVQLREDLNQCTRARSDLETNVRILQATTQSWPLSNGTPYALFGIAVGLLIGMFAHVLLARLMVVPAAWLRRSSTRDGEREYLFDELRQALQTHEVETLRELLRRYRSREV